MLEHPKLADVSVIGVPDEVRGEMVCAVVVERDADDPLTLEETVAYLREKELMTQKIPERIERVEVLPRNPSGKVLKRELRQRFGATD